MKNTETNNIQSHSRNTVLCDGFLIPMTDFVLQIDDLRPRDLGQDFSSWNLSKLITIENYAKFLKQPLKLEMFVPCDENGNVLEEPKMRPERNSFDEEDMDYDAQELYDYIKAKEKVLFELKIDNDYKFDISDYKFICNYYVNLENWLKNNDVIYKIKLSQTALDYLDFNSKIKAGQEAIELLKELRGFAPYCTDHRQRVDDILSKVSVDMEVSQNEA